MGTNRQLFKRHLAPTSESPLGFEIERAEGVYMIDPAGKKYLDLISGICVSALGHNHPKVIRAVQEQVGRHMHLMVYGELVQAPQVLFASKLAKTLPASLSSVYFVNSGSEAVEGALKLAKRVTGRKEMISCKNGYHGSTHGAMSMMGNLEFTNAFRPLLPDVGFIRFNEIADLQCITEQTACVLVEPIQGEAGVHLASADYLSALRQKCTETRALLIFDEIQTGMGRTGSLWAMDQYGVVPDIITVAKALGGGMPLGAFISSPALMQELSHDPVLGHITTFGGHPVSCAAGLAALEVLLEDNLIAAVTEKEQLFRELLVHPQILEVRGRGLLLAVQLATPDAVQKTIAGCLEDGLLTDWFLFCDSALRVAPPLTISFHEIEAACKIILKNLDRASA